MSISRNNQNWPESESFNLTLNHGLEVSTDARRPNETLVEYGIRATDGALLDELRRKLTFARLMEQIYG